MATARLAMSYDRDVMAFPGRPEDKYSAGCNFLIKENIAALVENATDIARILDLKIKEEPPQQPDIRLFDDEDKATIITACLEKNGDTSIDELVQFLAIPAGELAALLLQLELEGKILALPGKRYALV